MQRSGRGAGWILVLALVVVVATGEPSTAQEGGDGFAVLVDQIAALFPSVDGEVIEARGDGLILSVGRRDGLEPGAGLEVYREGRELRHPRTGEVLGRIERSLGRVHLVDVQEAFSVATAVAMEAAPAPGDRVRLSAGKLKLTVVTLSDGVKESLVEAAARELVEGLNRTGRFQALSGDRVTVWLASQGLPAPAALEARTLSSAAAALDLEHVLVVLFTQEQRRPYMQVRLFSPPATGARLSTALFVPSSIKPVVERPFSGGTAAGTVPAPRPQSLLARLFGLDAHPGTYSAGQSSIALQEAARLGFPVTAMDVAVAPADGEPRVVVSDGNRILRYRIVDHKLVPEHTWPVRGMGRVLSLQLADVTGSGTLEVVVNRHDHDAGMNTTIYGLRDGRPVVVAGDIGDLVLALDTDRDGVRETLWAQRFNPATFFTSGQAERVVLKNGVLQSAGPVRVPDIFRATGATVARIAGKDRGALVFIDRWRRLNIYDELTELWRSSVSVGGGGAKTSLPVMVAGAISTTVVNLEPMPLAVDLDGDGIDEVVVPMNDTAGWIGVVFRTPAGFRFQTVNTGFEGVITALGAVPGAEFPRLIAAVVRGTGLLGIGGGETQILVSAGE